MQKKSATTAMPVIADCSVTCHTNVRAVSYFLVTVFATLAFFSFGRSNFTSRIA